MITPMEDFPLEQSRDETLCHAFDQVMKIDGCQVHPSTALTHPYFVVIRDRLYRASRDARTGELTQLLVPTPWRVTLGLIKHSTGSWPGFTGRAFRRM